MDTDLIRTAGIVSALVAITGVAGLLQARRGVSYAPAAGGPAAAAAGHAGSSAARSRDTYDLERPLREYLGLPDGAASRDGRLSPSVAERLAPHDPIVLIATIPDPIDSLHGYRFDFLYGAIQAAIGEAGFTLDRFALPWQEGGDGPSSAGEEGHAERAAGPRRRDPARLRERWPGLVLFRESPRPNPYGNTQPSLDYRRERLLILLLVGETATWGIHKEAFIRSLELRASSPARSAHPGTPALVLGPYFTGSASSMRVAIDRWLMRQRAERFLARAIAALAAWRRLVGDLSRGRLAPEGLPRGAWPAEDLDTFVLYSGTATGIDRDAFSGLGRAGAGPRVDFGTTVHNEETLLVQLLKHLTTRDRLSATPRRIAVLVPPETALEQKIESLIRRESGSLGTGAEKQILFLPLPLHLSQAQGAYAPADMDRLLRGKEPAEEKRPQPSGLGGDDGVADEVPVLAARSGVTPRSEFLLMAKTLATISREDIRYVGVLAADARAKVFLVQLIERYCPDVEVFFSANDMLMASPEYANYMQGAIVSSTYPLFSPSQVWDFGYQGMGLRFTFSSEFDQGCFNATLLLIDRARGGGGPGLKRRLLDYGPPDPLGRVPDPLGGAGGAGGGGTPPATAPPVWISIIGKHGPWPVAVYPDAHKNVGTTAILPVGPDRGSGPGGPAGPTPAATEARASSPAEHAATGPDDPRLMFTVPWTLLFVAVSLVCLLFCRCFAEAFPRRGDRSATMPKWNHAHLAIVDLFRPTADEMQVRPRRWYVAALFFTILAAYILVAWPGLVPLVFGAQVPRRSSRSLAGAAVFVALIVACLLPFVPLSGRVAGLRSRLRSFYRPGLVALAGLAVASYYHEIMALAVPTFALFTVSALCLMIAINARPELSDVKDDPSWMWHPGRATVPADRGGMRRAWIEAAGMVTILVSAVAVDAFVPVRLLPRAPLLERYFQFLRTVHFGSSVSPTMAIILLGAAMCCWPLYHLRRMRLNRRFRVECPFARSGGERPGPFGRLADLHLDLVATVTHPCRTSFRRPLSLAITAAFLVFLFQVAYRFIPSIEGPIFNLATTVVFLTAPFLFLFVLLHTYRLLGQYRELLRQLAMLPMSGAYARLPQKVSFTFGRYLSTFQPRVSNLQVLVQQYDSLVNDPGVPEEEGDDPADPIRREVIRARDDLRDHHIRAVLEREMGQEDNLLELIAAGYEGPFEKGEVILGRSRTMHRLILSARRCLVPLALDWRGRPADRAYPDGPAAGGEGGAHGRRDGPPPADAAGDGDGDAAGGLDRRLTAWLDRAEELVAMVTVVYVSQFAVHLRNNVMFLTACPLLLLVAVNTYPFQPNRLLALFFWALSLATLLIVIMFMVALDRDEILSRIAKTRPAYFSWSSLPVILKYVVPLIGILITQHPDVSEFLYTYLGPLFRVLEK